MILTPYSLEFTSMLCYWQRGIQVADGMKVANQLILRLGNYPGLSRWTQRIHKSPREERRLEPCAERTPPPTVGSDDGGRGYESRYVGKL